MNTIIGLLVISTSFCAVTAQLGGVFRTGCTDCPRPLLAQNIVPVAAAPLPCPPPPREPSDKERCHSVEDERGCLIDYECEPAKEPPPPCPPAPEKPKKSERCNWIAVLDSNNCIMEYQCEPIPVEPCPPPPLSPDDNERCKWVPLKNFRGCIYRYACVPAVPIATRLPLARLAPLAPLAPLSFPLPPRPAFPLSFPSFPLPAPVGDTNNFCCYWASLGECDRNPDYMRTSCAQSCGIPGCTGFVGASCTAGLTGCPYAGAAPQPLPAPLPFPAGFGSAMPFRSKRT